MKGLRFLIILLILIPGGILFAQSADNLAFHIRGGVDVPLGTRSALFNEDAAWLIGGGTTISAQYISPSLSFMYFEGNFGLGFEPSQAQVLTLGSIGAGTGFDFRIGDRLSWQLGPEAGGTYGVYQSGDSAFNPYYGGRTGIVLDLSPSFAITAGGSYKYHMGWDQTSDSFTDLYQGVSGWVGGVFRLTPESGRQKINIINMEHEPIFPVFYSYYESNPIGTVTLRNGENSSISNVDIYFNVGEYMEQPMLCESLDSLGRKEEAVVDLNAIFTSRILNLTESSKVSAEVRVDYTYLGERFSFNHPQTLRVLDRNSMTWDDDRKAASFVTPRDPTVLIFSKNTAGLIRDMGENPLNLNFRIAMGLFETLRLYGMNYVIDPKSAYAEASDNEYFLDYLQFPSQSLVYRAGDCDDLSILMSALLESVGIETAFITVPGHIFMAFSLGLSEIEAKRDFTNTEDFIFVDDTAWVPVEITLVQQGFLKAVSTGAKQWRDAVRLEVEGFFPIHKAWEEYQPVGFVSGSLSLLFPDAEDIIDSYSQSLDAFVSQEIREKVDYYNQKISLSDNARTRNSLGVLYGRYGLFDKAEEQFRAALRLDRNAYTPTFNLGNIKFLKGEYSGALGFYESAAAIKPDNALVVAGLARTKFELENFNDAQDDFIRLTEISPELAENYNYIGKTGNSIVRASAAMDKGATYWGEEHDE
ncbi:MAG: hypothetical protein PQJ61_08320 [Spirochaetales bacterium]|uniref:Tetratricopeptide repeat protein n=1 Tax=Candidatus Thalassospirochaeta sargassi TaxID=3119039 RepID=A0AAJ1MKF3_9SPIO|nr:hypothetical protein [Spirochaetales bacterium]